MAPKKKFAKVALTDFLGGGSWADDVEELPTAPAARPEGFSSLSGGGGGDFMSRPDRAEREYGNGPPREELPMPTSPPYTAFLGNLAFDVGETEVESFFDGLKLNSVKLISDMDGKPKGFGYVEFGSVADLSAGLGRSGSQLAGRTVRVSVAEPPKGGFGKAGGGGFLGSGVADEKSSWRREGPLPPLAGGGGPPERRSYGNPSPRFGGGGGGEEEPERDWSTARGSRFTPSGPADGSSLSRFGGSGGAGGAAPARSGGFVSESGAAAEAASQWRTGKPLSGPAPGGFVPRGGGERDALPHQQRGPRVDGPPGPADTEKEWVRGAKFVPAPEARPQRAFQAGPGGPPTHPHQQQDEPADWRSGPRRGPPSRHGSAENSAGSSPQLQARRPMTLLPRSAAGGPAPPSSSSPSAPSSPSAGEPSSLASLPSPASTTTTGAAAVEPTTTTTTTTSSKASPFGNARPVDLAAKEQAIEAKLAAKAAEQKQRREQKQAELKAAAREKEATMTAEGGGGEGGEKKAAAAAVGGGGRGTKSPSSAAAEPANWRSAKSTTTVAPALEPIPSVSGGKKATAAGAGAADHKKQATTTAAEKKKKDFSFAALAVEGGDDDDDDDEDEVDQVAKGVEKVRV